jgi:excisionase family DNA binding protein
MHDAEEKLTRGQVARLLNVSPERIRQLTNSGRLRFTATPLGRLYARRDVEQLAQQRRQARGSSPPTKT